MEPVHPHGTLNLGELAPALDGTWTAETVDGRPYNNRYCHVMRILDGKIIEVTEYFDTELTSSIFGSASNAV